MTYYSKFDVSIQCEESMEVSPEEQAEIFQMMADEHVTTPDFAGYEEWLDTLENKEVEEIKDWLGGYQNIVEGDTYNGIDV
jgi:hypothetical protein